MGLFESIRGQFIDIIEWLDSSNDTIVYRFERHNNEIKQGAKLTVRPGQVAIFVNEGHVADIFDPGMHELYTRNLPILSTLQGWKYGFNSPFKAEVYFFSTRVFTNLKWGTANPITIRDPELGPVRLRAFGTYSIRVADPAVFLKEIVSTDGLFQVDEISDHFRNNIVTSVASWIGKGSIPLLDFASQYREMGNQICAGIQADMQGLGLQVTQLLIENISLPPEVEAALDKRASIGLLGNMQQYAQYQAANAIENSSKNPGGGNPALDLGVGLAMGQQIVAGFQQQQNPPAAPPPPLGQTQWYISDNGQRLGPFTINQLIQQGITPQSYVWRTGLDAWKQASELSELTSAFASVPPPPPVAPPPPPVQTEWFIYQNNQRLGPFSPTQLAQQGIVPDTLLWKAGQNGWKKASELPELASLLP